MVNEIFTLLSLLFATPLFSCQLSVRFIGKKITEIL